MEILDTDMLSSYCSYIWRGFEMETNLFSGLEYKSNLFLSHLFISPSLFLFFFVGNYRIGARITSQPHVWVHG